MAPLWLRPSSRPWSRVPRPWGAQGLPFLLPRPRQGLSASRPVQDPEPHHPRTTCTCPSPARACCPQHLAGQQRQARAAPPKFLHGETRIDAAF